MLYLYQQQHLWFNPFKLDLVKEFPMVLPMWKCEVSCIYVSCSKLLFSLDKVLPELLLNYAFLIVDSNSGNNYS